MKVGCESDQIVNSSPSGTEGFDIMHGIKRKWKTGNKSNKSARQPLSAKPPLQALYETFGKMEFDIASNGPGPNFGFTAKFTLNSEIFEGSGLSKKKAKSEAAKHCLIKHAIEFNPNSEADRKAASVSLPPLGPFSRAPIFNWVPNMDFSKDYTSFDEGAFFANPNLGHSFDDNMATKRGMGDFSANFKRLRDMQIDFNHDRAAEFPCMVMNELFPNINEKIVWLDTGSLQKFSCEVEINGYTYSGKAKGKRHAKYELATSILSAILGIKSFKGFKSAALSSKGGPKPISKKHPFCQVKLMDPNSEFEDQELISESGEMDGWEVNLKVNGKEYRASDNDKAKARLKASKQACQDNIVIDKTIDKTIDTTKNPVQMLYEYHGNVDFIEENVGDKNESMFLVGVEAEGKTFTCKALSKKKAKTQLAKDIFEELNQIDPSAWQCISSESKEEIKINHNPLSVLNELHPGLEYTVTDSGIENNQTQFKACIQFGENLFEGVGSTKKSAKTEAASKILDAFYNITDADMSFDSMKNLDYKTDIENSYSTKIVEAIRKKLSQVFQPEIPYKVLAAIVMAKSMDGVMTDCFEVISIGTGTKCIGGSSINSAGQVLNDCHAEIIACRGLRQFLFDQLHLSITNKESCLEKIKGATHYQLKPNMHLYLYINTAPCGDGRVYNSTSIASKNKTVGALRTKIENGQGTVPVPANTVQTTDGILEGERLLTMSCSDKIMKWNVLGVQGSLLSHFVKPIYLRGIIIGELYNYEHLTRSLFSRMQGLTGVVLPFKSTKPDFGHNSSTDGRDTSKATSNSYNWYYGENTIEVINGVTGKTPVATSSRLCKMAFFQKFCELAKLSNLEMKASTYHEAKESATCYQTSKQLFFKHLDDKGFGKWIGKPLEQDTFS